MSKYLDWLSARLAGVAAVIRKPWMPWLLLVLVLFLSAYAVERSLSAANEAKETTSRLEGEVTERRDVGCIGAEAKHAEEIRDLERTYEILRDPPAVYKELLKNPLVIDSFRETILAAVNDEDTLGEFVSPFCDDPNIGLPEPDPILPETPQYVIDLIPGIEKQIVKQLTVTLEDAKKEAKQQKQP